MEKFDQYQPAQVIQANISGSGADKDCSPFDKMQQNTTLSLWCFSSNHEKIAEQPQLRIMLQNNWPVTLKCAQVTRVKELLPMGGRVGWWHWISVDCLILMVSRGCGANVLVCRKCTWTYLSVMVQHGSDLLSGGSGINFSVQCLYLFVNFRLFKKLKLFPWILPSSS